MSELSTPAAPATSPALWGLLAEFETPEALLRAADAVRSAGYRHWDAHAPYPVHGLDEAVGIRRTPLPWLVFACGVAGAAGGLALQWYTNAFDYKFLTSGKPYFSIPANIPITFETTILLAALGAFLGALALNGLPQLYHVLFTKPRFRRATADRFFISIEARDEKFDRAKLEQMLRAHGAVAVEAVEETD